MSGSRSLKVAQYLLLPQVLPRIATLLFGGFNYFAYFMAQVYRGVRLLPEGHPYLNAAEIGHFSIPDVVAAAGARLKYRRENIDQVIIFYVLLMGLVLLAAQAFFLVIGMFAPQAMALSLTTYFGNYHVTGGVDHYQDLAFIMLDRVFGVPGIFDSCVSINAPCYMAAPNDTWANAATVYTPATFPWPFHLALQAMFAFYSTGLLIIAMMIFLYFVIVIVAETAQTGTPFGRRFNKVWAPLRLVVALGLLIPISNGLNTAQYIVLYAAKLGSNFATNGWVQFNAQLENGRMMSESMVALPKSPDISDLLQFMMLAHACKAVQEGIVVYEDKPESWEAEGSDKCSLDVGEQEDDAMINAYLVKFTGTVGDDAVTLESQDYDQARTFFGNGDMTVRIGDRGCSKEHNKYSGHTKPVCGELVLTSPTQENETSSGAYTIQKGYFDLVKHLWGEYADGSETGKPWRWRHFGFCNNTGSSSGGYAIYGDMTSKTGDMELRKKSISFAQAYCPNTVKDAAGDDIQTDRNLIEDPTSDWIKGTKENYIYGMRDVDAPANVTANSSYPPGNSVATAVVTNIIRTGIRAERDIEDTKYSIPIDLIDRGWGGAGLWYNKIARANGALTGAAQATPKITHYPELMETVAKAKLRDNKNVSAENLFSPVSGADSAIQLKHAGEQEGVMAMQAIYSIWRDNGASSYKPPTGNVFYDVLNWLFGTEGLFDLRDPGNQNVHPLALLTSMGKSLLEASIRNIALASGGNILGSILGADAGGPVASAGASILFTAVSLTLGAGIILYYVLPFMPFVYFFFAVGSWVKEVFEAVVGVPLWALAHIRIDGDGLPGPHAINGYYMIFEIFLRPIMIVFGLIAAVSVFAAMASTLNAVFDIAVINAGGANFTNSSQASFMEFARGPIDQLFYTVMYAVLMYIMAMASFKMIDLIPSQVMRWTGMSVNAFANSTGGSADSLMQTMSTQGTGTVNQAVGALQQGSGAVGKGIGALIPRSGG